MTLLDRVDALEARCDALVENLKQAVNLLDERTRQCEQLLGHLDRPQQQAPRPHEQTDAAMAYNQNARAFAKDARV